MNDISDFCLEAERKILEELEVIENAIATRIRRNPELFYQQNDVLKSAGGTVLHIPKANISANRIYRAKKSKRSRKQIKAQEYEISVFLGRYRKLLRELEQLQATTDTQVQSLKDDTLSFEKFEKSTSLILEGHTVDTRTINDVKKDYELFGSSTESDKNILSRSGQIVDVNKIFKRDENFGMYLDLSEQYSRWLNLIKDADFTVISFVKLLESFVSDKFITDPTLERGSKEYQTFLTDVGKYYRSFYSKVYPLVDKEIISKRLQDGFNKWIRAGIPRILDKPDGEVFSVVCNRWFESKAAFEAELGTADFETLLQKGKRYFLKEYTFHFYSELLAKQIHDTISFIERKLAFTDEELQEEMNKFQEQYEAPLYSATEKEDELQHTDDIEAASRKTESIDPSNPYNLPVGPDGFPIPRWLYKVQGLDVKYVCEICGNQVFHGRKEFERHFQSKKHIEGLRSLGITPSPAFKDISTISEAKALWQSLQTTSAHVLTLTSTSVSRDSYVKPVKQLDIEAEDDEGNVMSVKVYEELKKQGLL